MDTNYGLERIVGLDSETNPIVLPEHPYISALKDFGGDELVAGVIDIFATGGVNYLVPRDLRQYILPFVGPVTEKIGFFPLHIYKAKKKFNSLSPDKREEFSYYLKQGLIDGVANLTKDVCIHDPTYISMMYYGLNQFPDINPGVLSAVSYVSAVLFVAGLDVTKDEFSFWNTKRKLKNAGFHHEKYYEARFHIDPKEMSSQEFISLFSERFGLDRVDTITYRDSYFQSKIPNYSGRGAKIRFRTRGRRDFETDLKYGSNPNSVNSAQVIFTRASESKKHASKHDQCRFFPVEKEKVCYTFAQNLPNLVDEIEDTKVKLQLEKFLSNTVPHFNLEFERTYARDGELIVCTDKIISSDNGHLARPAYLAELKVFTDTKKLIDAMRFLMVNCPIVAVQTTQSKPDIYCGVK